MSMKEKWDDVCNSTKKSINTIANHWAMASLNQKLVVGALGIALAGGIAYSYGGQEPNEFDIEKAIASNPKQYTGVENLYYSALLNAVQNGNVSSIIIGDEVTPFGTEYSRQPVAFSQLKDNQGSYKTHLDYTSLPDLTNKIYEHNQRDQDDKNDIDFSFAPETPVEGPGFFESNAGIFLLIAAIIGATLYQTRKNSPGGMGGAAKLKKSPAKLVKPEDNKTRFDDVAGAEEAKEDVEEIIDYLRDPKKYHDLGGKAPKGILFVGPPGTGKTLLAKALAGEAEVPFHHVSGSDFVEMFVGLGASKVREMFAEVKKHTPAILFIDEIDAVGKKRGASSMGGNDEREQTLNQLLIEMDGFEKDTGVIVIAATNREDVLDTALLRRFGSKVQVPLPDILGREAILKVHTKNVPLAEDVDLHTLARATPGFSGSDLSDLIEGAIKIAVRENGKKITNDNIGNAVDNIIMGGKPRKTAVMTYKELKNTAYHEAAHAIVGAMTECDPLHKVSIVARGHALGVTINLPEEDRHGYSIQDYEDRIAMALAGRLGEEINVGKKGVTTGASNDIERLTQMAREMACKFGMTELGPINYGIDPQTGQLNLSEMMLKKIDTVVEAIVMDQDTRARGILEDNIDKVHKLAQALLDYETVDGKEFEIIISDDFDGTLPGRETVIRKNNSGIQTKAPANDDNQKPAVVSKAVSSLPTLGR
ncbi:MAG: hypothetical protein CO093_06060 [Alphaproteobacteria bacterium CG_4_9_14_3_um_filter_47_13]|nr:MAG: hypothetical protein CO093_06060 [Alphaproteobacteria bacterium CG_4_9_14_3_um_filter_47_13]